MIVDRRTQILDAALRVLATEGMRGLTHRATDAAADIPVGSTSYYFRTRSALVSGCLERLLETDLQSEVPMLRGAEGDLGALVETLVQIAVGMATNQRDRTLARHELSLAAVRQPQVRERLGAARSVVRSRTAELLRSTGVDDAETTADRLLAVLDGLAFTAVVHGPSDRRQLAAWVRPVLENLLSAGPGPSERG